MARHRGRREARHAARTASGPQGPRKGSSARRRQLAGPSAIAVVQRRTLLTETGMKGVQGGDPAGASRRPCASSGSRGWRPPDAAARLLPMARRWSALALGAALLAAVAVAGPASGAGTGDQLTSSWAKREHLQPDPARRPRAARGRRLERHGWRVRFTAQWLSPDGWVPLSGEATSPWQDAGSAEFTWQQAGWTFALNVPPEPATSLPAARGGGDGARLGPAPHESRRAPAPSAASRTAAGRS